MKKYILWDHDGVLVDTEGWYFEATRRALAELGIELGKASYLRRMVDGLSSWELALAAGFDEQAVARQRRRRDAYYRAHLTVEDIAIPGVVDVLRALHGKYRMAIVTTSKRADFEVIHRGREILRYMDFALVREDYVKSKPDPEPYLLAMQRFGATAEDCLVVEDSERGLRSALAAGVDCAVVHSDFTAGHDFSRASYRLDSIAQLPALLTGEGHSARLP